VPVFSVFCQITLRSHTDSSFLDQELTDLTSHVIL